jgi:hypothetical protein
LEDIEQVDEEDPTPEPSNAQTRARKRKSAAQDKKPPPSKRQKKPTPEPIPSPSPAPESPSEVSAPESTPEPQPSNKRKRKHQPATSEDEKGMIEIRVHKLPPSSGGTRNLNEIDGFLQVVTEVLTSTGERIFQQDITQAKILDAFTEEVTIRLIEMTDAWDSNAILNGAVKRAQRKKNLLRQELLAIRKERGNIAREMELIRQEHEKGEKEISDLKLQQDFIADMDDLKAKITDDLGDDRVEVILFFVRC